MKNVKIELNLNNNVNYVNNVNVSNQNAIPQNAICNGPSNEKSKLNFNNSFQISKLFSYKNILIFRKNRGSFQEIHSNEPS